MVFFRSLPFEKLLMSEYLTCLECGEKVKEDVLTCPVCGFPIRESVEFSDYEDASKYLAKMNSGCLLTIIFFSFFLIFFY